MSDPSNQIVEFFHHADAAIGGYPSHLLERLADKVWDSGIRYSRRVLFNEAERKIREAGEAVSDKASPRLIADILRNADGVTDEAILDLWSTLLAKAASGNDKTIRPVYFGVISNLSPMDALFMAELGKPEMKQAILTDSQERKRTVGNFTSQAEMRLEKAGIDVENRRYCKDALERQGLIKVDEGGFCTMTTFGLGFYEAVCAPLAAVPNATP